MSRATPSGFWFRPEGRFFLCGKSPEAHEEPPIGDLDDIDHAFFEAKLPKPTFGTGGLMWAALTLALLTLPVVIVATREAVRGVPLEIRHAALAVGATKWQATSHHVMPYALPGVVTGVIIGISRALGETAPLIMIGGLTFVAFLPITVPGDAKFATIGAVDEYGAAMTPDAGCRELWQRRTISAKPSPGEAIESSSDQFAPSDPRPRKVLRRELAARTVPSPLIRAA